MMYDENETVNELSFKMEGDIDDDEPAEPLEESTDFRFDEDPDDDPDKDH